MCLFSNLCTDDDGSLQFFTDDDDDDDEAALKSMWSLTSWAEEAVVYASAIIHRDNGVVPKVMRQKVEEGRRGMSAFFLFFGTQIWCRLNGAKGEYAWSSADVHVLFRQEHLWWSI